ncbi:four helix bundle protein [Mucilaginibacter pineti]
METQLIIAEKCNLCVDADYADLLLKIQSLQKRISAFAATIL